MDVGMLWFDNDRRKDLSSKVTRAANYYREKYGRAPNVCFVHPSMLGASNGSGTNGNGSSGQNGSTPKNESETKKLMAGKIEVRSADTILPNHLWIGINGKN